MKMKNTHQKKKKKLTDRQVYVEKWKKNKMEKNSTYKKKRKLKKIKINGRKNQTDTNTSIHQTLQQTQKEY